MEFRLLVRGDRACFRRPEFVADIVSYDVMTPLAAHGIVEALHAAPDLRWRIDEIRVLNAVRVTWMAPGEMIAIDAGGPLPVRIAGPADHGLACVLSDVAYALTARIEGGAGEVHAAALRRRLASGPSFRLPYLGMRGFPAEVTLLQPDAAMPEGALAGSGTVDVGWMLYDRGARDGSLRYLRATMVDGVIDLRRRDALILAG